ncbi:MAG: DUF2007 domain-containing protein [Salibacteraceae bacterium]|nr:DUF2007 domain-containing protein [Salibacteraceae bacterium]|tara:strand:+ start:5044 stop:5265 length:222 start_codon:yes stop_codon:yes gene_type:complete
MEVNWTKVFTTNDSIQAELIKARLAEDDIQVAFVNKQDSMHLHLNMQFGLEVFVPKDNAFKAVQIINNMVLNE